MGYLGKLLRTVGKIHDRTVNNLCDEWAWEITSSSSVWDSLINSNEEIKGVWRGLRKKLKIKIDLQNVRSLLASKEINWIFTREKALKSSPVKAAKVWSAIFWKYHKSGRLQCVIFICCRTPQLHLLSLLKMLPK